MHIMQQWTIHSPYQLLLFIVIIMTNRYGPGSQTPQTQLHIGTLYLYESCLTQELPYNIKQQKL